MLLVLSCLAAYRRVCLEHHPDKKLAGVTDEEEKKKAEDYFKQIQEAYGVGAALDILTRTESVTMLPGALHATNAQLQCAVTSRSLIRQACHTNGFSSDSCSQLYPH